MPLTAYRVSTRRAQLEVLGEAAAETFVVLGRLKLLIATARRPAKACICYDQDKTLCIGTALIEGMLGRDGEEKYKASSVSCSAGGPYCISMMSMTQ